MPPLLIYTVDSKALLISSIFFYLFILLKIHKSYPLIISSTFFFFDYTIIFRNGSCILSTYLSYHSSNVCSDTGITAFYVQPKDHENQPFFEPFIFDLSDFFMPSGYVIPCVFPCFLEVSLNDEKSWQLKIRSLTAGIQMLSILRICQ